MRLKKEYKISLKHLMVPGRKVLKTKFRTSKDINVNLKAFLMPKVEEL